MPFFKPLKISHYTSSSAVGLGKESLLNAIQEQQTGLTANDFPGCDLDTFIGKVDNVESTVLPSTMQSFNCRNNRLTYLALQQDGFADCINELKSRVGASKIGVLLGTSTSGIQETEAAFQYYADNDCFPSFDYLKTHNTFSLVDFVQQLFSLTGPAHAVSTACSSSAKVFATASRYIASGLCDAAIVGGVDSLCLTTLYGFNSLELLSSQLCKPWDVNRNGINIGEGAGFAILEKASGYSMQESDIALLGYGESSDAYHMSSPHPQGLGAVKAMTNALDCMQISPEQIDYVNLHGTATQSNDSAEDKAITTVFDNVACSSTKGWTGHTLGAAGIIGVVTACLSIENDLMPASLNSQEKDPALQANVLFSNKQASVNNTLVNSFGFGGSNCSLLIGKMD